MKQSYNAKCRTCPATIATHRSNSSQRQRVWTLEVKGGQDAFAFRHPSLGKTEVFSLLASDVHHHKGSPIGTGRLTAMVGTAEAPADDGDDLQILFGLVLASRRAHPKKDELPHAYTHSATLNPSKLLSSQDQPLNFCKGTTRTSKTGRVPPASTWTPLMRPSRDRKARSQRPSFYIQCGCSDVLE